MVTRVVVAMVVVVDPSEISSAGYQLDLTETQPGKVGHRRTQGYTGGHRGTQGDTGGHRGHRGRLLMRILEIPSRNHQFLQPSRDLVAKSWNVKWIGVTWKNQLQTLGSHTLPLPCPLSSFMRSETHYE